MMKDMLQIGGKSFENHISDLYLESLKELKEFSKLKNNTRKQTLLLIKLEGQKPHTDISPKRIYE